MKRTVVVRFTDGTRETYTSPNVNAFEITITDGMWQKRKVESITFYAWPKEIGTVYFTQDAPPERTEETE